MNNLLPFYKRNLALAFPIILSQLGQVTVSLVDTFMVGKLGTLELAAAAFANSIFVLIFIFGLGFSLGQTPHVGKAFGKKQAWKITLFFQNALLINTLLSVVLFLALYYSQSVLYYMRQPDQVVQLALPYFDWLLLSLIPCLLFFTSRQFAEGLGNTKIAMWITLAGNLINIIFNYLFIFGKFGFPQMGVEGAGVATFIARCTMGSAFLIAIFWHPFFKTYTQKFTWQNFRKSAIFQLIGTGLPISGQLVVEVLAFSCSAIMIGWINEVNLAAHQIVLQLASATFMMALGVASATTIRVSHQYGAGDFKATRMAATASMHIVTLFMLCTALCFILFRNDIPKLFSSDPEVIAIAAQLFIVAGLFQIFDGLQTVGLATLRGLADVKFAMYIAFVSYILIALPVGYLFGFVFNFGAVGVWVGLSISLIVAAVAYRLRFFHFMNGKF